MAAVAVAAARGGGGGGGGSGHENDGDDDWEDDDNDNVSIHINTVAVSWKILNLSNRTIRPKRASLSILSIPNVPGTGACGDVLDETLKSSWLLKGILSHPGLLPSCPLCK